jgi:enoyl-CoA hydratase/carnithine racemase
MASGAVHELVGPESLLPRALEAAEGFAAVPPESYRETKRLLRLRHHLPADVLAKAQAASIAIWSRSETLAAVGEFVARTLKRQ